MVEIIKSMYLNFILLLYKNDILTFNDYTKAIKRLDKKFEVLKNEYKKSK